MADQLISANHAAAMAAAMAGNANRSARGFCAGLYPITPSTECMEYLCVAELSKGQVVRVESEHSAMGVCIGAAAAGARTFTTTSSNGLAYMAENVYVAALMRLPVVMVAANRALGPPWNLWADHGDSLMLRDSGWIQIYCADNQEVFDSVLMAYRIAEDKRILLPVMVCQEGFILSHSMAETNIASQEEVDGYLPTLDLPHRLRDDARTMGGVDTPAVTEAHRAQHHAAMSNFFEVYGEAQDEFERKFGRRPPDLLVPYKLEDAEAVLISMGTISSNVDCIVDEARLRGVKVGSIRVRGYRPFPELQLKELLRGIGRVGVLDRDISLGFGGALWGEARGVAEPGAISQGYILGVGGGDVRPKHIEALLEDLLKRDSATAPIVMETNL
ncbi:MAG: pyruvate ferredoxin oxidoreductase [Deltaproteobacteria bacterium]|nr:MAG: pyruvate ferredoxin oxidoreductase [Deltaproteobacteria bacterium]